MSCRFVFPSLAAAALACASQYPAEFAADPDLVARIDEIVMQAASERLCPGEVLRVSYTAKVGEQWVIPIAPHYDSKKPPLLHVSSLLLSGDHATASDDGSWRADPDPLASVMDGFGLHAAVRAKPTVHASLVIVPEYSCLPRVFAFHGHSGPPGSTGEPGPDVVVRLRVLSSPFHERLLVASIEVGEDQPVFTMVDLAAVPPSYRLRVESWGGAGGDGRPGTMGSPGVAGRECGEPGGGGGDGARGGAGGSGGQGGRISVYVPSDAWRVADIVDAVAPGGRGGPGGAGGAGGPGGNGTLEVVDSAGRVICQRGANGARGTAGASGSGGPSGNSGPPARVFALPRNELFGPDAPPAVRALVEYTERRMAQKAP